jgi:hypothetical protein
LSDDTEFAHGSRAEREYGGHFFGYYFALCGTEGTERWEPRRSV